MPKYFCLLLLLVATACMAGDQQPPPQQPPAKVAKDKTTLLIKCPECEAMNTVTLRNKDISCHGGHSVTNGVVAQYSAKVTCPSCKEKFTTSFEQYKKAPPVAVVLP